MAAINLCRGEKRDEHDQPAQRDHALAGAIDAPPGGDAVLGKKAAEPRAEHRPDIGNPGISGDFLDAEAVGFE
jgi:hypothetical protein